MAKHAFKNRPTKGGADATWYMTMVMVHPDHEGRGYCSLLTRETFEVGGPGACFTLDASTAKSRDQYLHIGFEVGLSHWTHKSYLAEPCVIAALTLQAWFRQSE